MRPECYCRCRWFLEQGPLNCFRAGAKARMNLICGGMISWPSFLGMNHNSARPELYSIASVIFSSGGGMAVDKPACLNARSDDSRTEMAWEPPSFKSPTVPHQVSVTLLRLPIHQMQPTRAPYAPQGECSTRPTELALVCHSTQTITKLKDPGLWSLYGIALSALWPLAYKSSHSSGWLPMM